MAMAERSALKKMAPELGYELVKGQKIRGQPIYVRTREGTGPMYITPDVGSGVGAGGAHSGGSWKGADSIGDLGSKSTRQGTYDENLTRIGD
jgi:hypothetical protein